jgi:hypothetical protein
MARTYLVFGDIEGKLDALRVECARCQRKGRYARAPHNSSHDRVRSESFRPLNVPTKPVGALAPQPSLASDYAKAVVLDLVQPHRA